MLKSQCALLSVFIMSGFLSTTAFAGYYDLGCINNCFRTKHECEYCAYQCYSDRERGEFMYSQDTTPCPLAGPPYQY